MRNSWLLVMAFGFSAPFCSSQTSVTAKLVTPDTLRSRLERGSVKAKTRQETVRTLFEEAGCRTEEQRVSRNSSNVICRLPGDSDSTIVVGAHFDFADEGQGIVDDWSGTALLPSLFEAIKIAPRKHTFIFVAFAEEETGLNGSSRYVKELNKEQRSSLRAFVNLECLGLGRTNVWLHRATPDLVTKLMEVANATHMDVRGVNVDSVGDDDSHPFVSAHMPVITLHSVTQETLPVLHSAKDTIAAIHIDDYDSTYRLAAYYLAYLDSQLQ